MHEHSDQISLRVARQALAVATKALRPYAHRFSPKMFTQPQLFACLVLKTFFKTDYRGLARYLQDLPDLRRPSASRRAPLHHPAEGQPAPAAPAPRPPPVPRHHPPLPRAPPPGPAGRLRLHRPGLRPRQLLLRPPPQRRRKAMADRHLQPLRQAGSWPSTGQPPDAGGLGRPRPARPIPTASCPCWTPRLANVRIEAALADAGYDSEPNHRYAREERGVRSFIPATIGRPTTKLPSGRYRRQMKQRLNKHYGRYGQRWQAETGFSMFKRRLGAAVNGRSYWGQCRELLLMAITYNIMLL